MSLSVADPKNTPNVCIFNVVLFLPGSFDSWSLGIFLQWNGILFFCTPSKESFFYFDKHRLWKHYYWCLCTANSTHPQDTSVQTCLFGLLSMHRHSVYSLFGLYSRLRPALFKHRWTLRVIQHDQFERRIYLIR